MKNFKKQYPGPVPQNGWVMPVISIVLCLLIMLFCPHSAFSREKTDIKANLTIPDSSHFQVLKTYSGSINIGRIVKIGDNDIEFATEFGTLTIPIVKISEINEIPITMARKAANWFENPNITRLYFAPTARMLKAGEGYFADYYVFFPSFAYGITNNFTIGGGLSLLPGIRIDRQIFYFTPKVGLKTIKNLNFAAGALLIKLPDFDDEDDLDDDDDDDDAPLIGILYGVGTIGSSDASFTVGVGSGFVGSEFADRPMIVLGGEKRLSRRIAFVSENWIVPGTDNPLISYGVRFLGEKISADLALINTIGEEMIFPGIPYLDFIINF